jgi:hypothetical protein
MVLMILPFDVVVVPVETMLLYFYIMLGLGGLSAIFLFMYLVLRFYRMGPLGKAELGNRRGEIGIVRETRGKGRVVRLRQQVKGILVSREPHIYFTGANTATDVVNGPSVYLIEGTSAEAVPPQVARIAEALNEGKIPGIEAKDINQMALEFAEKWYYPRYVYTPSTEHLDKDQRARFLASSPGEYEIWKQRRIADLKAELQFNARKSNELSYMREIKTGVRRAVSTIDGFTGDDPDNIKPFYYNEGKVVEGVKTILAQDELSLEEKTTWTIQRIYDAAQAKGIAVPISAIANWNATTPTQATIEDSNIATELKARKEGGGAKASTTIIIIMILLGIALGGMLGYILHG